MQNLSKMSNVEKNYLKVQFGAQWSFDTQKISISQIELETEFNNWKEQLESEGREEYVEQFGLFEINKEFDILNVNMLEESDDYYIAINEKNEELIEKCMGRTTSDSMLAIANILNGYFEE